MFARPLLAAALLSACTGSPETSNLEHRQTPAPMTPAPPAAAPAPAEPAKVTVPASEPGVLTAEPPPGTELAPVRLSLKDASVYRITTIGNVALSGGVMAPTGYAREEQLELGDCSGEAGQRRCTVTHRYRKFEAEPPAGQVYEADEKLVHDLVTRHTLLANGAREGTTEVTGPAEQVASPAGKALADVHRFFCLRFPDQDIGVGAKWRDRCHMRTGGVVDTRDVVWELSKLDTVDGMRRAELTYLGTYSAPGPRGVRTGTVAGTLLFMVDPGEPHILKEVIQLDTSGAAGMLTSTTSLAYQFTRVVTDKAGKETLVRTDGAAFPKPGDPVKTLSKPADPAAKNPVP